ncbi:hypothetical protein DITRI_Ditri20bG0083700 [Diplodiscus trichospermus]
MRTRLSSGIQGTCNVKKSGGTNGESKFPAGKITNPPAKGAGRAKSSAQRSRTSNEAPRKMQSLTIKRNPTASSKATNFESENPFFLVVMRPSYITVKGCYLEFALHHKLKVGDTCAFELLEGHEISFRVTIFRGAQDANDHITAARESKNGHLKRKRGLNTSSQSESYFIGKDKGITSSPATKDSHVLVRKPKTEHGKFKQLMQWHTSGRLSIQKTANTVPSSFCEEYIKCVPRDVTLKRKGKLWPVMLNTSSKRPAQFGAGWWAFAAENKLQVGDVCVFEMIKRTNIVLEVSIF